MNIMDFGAVSSETLVQTESIQAAIDALSEGGIVYFPPGSYGTGTLYLKSNITLYLAPGARLWGSAAHEDYEGDYEGAIEAPSFSECLIYAEDAEHIEITGGGTIDGRGERFDGSKAFLKRPMLMRMIRCKDICFENIKLRNAGSWGVHMISCTDIRIHKTDVYSRVQHNNDGFDLDSCQNVLISNTRISSSDDSICLKSTTRQMCENFVITNCILSSDTAVLKLGTSSLLGFRGLVMSNCVVHDCPMGTIKLMMVDGGLIENIRVSNLEMYRVGSPLFVRTGKRNLKYDQPAEMDFWGEGNKNDDAPGKIRNISFSDIHADVTVTERDKTPIMITGIPDSAVENINLYNVAVEFPGGGTAEEANRTVAEDEYKYPEQWFFGTLPAYALYARHVKGLNMHHVCFSLKETDERPAMVLEDVSKRGDNNSMN